MGLNTVMWPNCKVPCYRFWDDLEKVFLLQMVTFYYCQKTVYFANYYKISHMYFIVIATKLDRSFLGGGGNSLRLRKNLKPTQLRK